MTHTFNKRWRMLGLVWLALLIALPAVAQRGRKATRQRPTVKTVHHTPSAAEQWVASLPAVASEVRAKANALYLEAVMQRAKGNNDATYELLTRAIALDPHLAAAYALLAPLTQQLYPDAPERATQQLECAVALAPNTKDFLSDLADHYAYTGEYLKALPLYERLMSFGGRVQPYLERIYSLYANNAVYDSALVTLDKLEQLNGSSEDFWMQRFKLYRAMGDTLRVEYLLDSLIAAQPESAEGISLKAMYYLETERPDSALRWVALGLAKDSTNMLLYRVRPVAYFGIGDTLHAHEAFYDYLMLPHSNILEQLIPVLRQSVSYPEQNMAEVALRVLYDRLPQEEKKQEMAELYISYLGAAPIDSIERHKHLQHIVKLVPDYTQARQLLLREYLRDTAFAEATALCDEGIRYTPKDPVYYYYKALFQSQANDHAAALATLYEGQNFLSNPKLNTALVSDYYGIMGDLLYRQGHSKAAWTALDSALVYNGANAMVLNNYAYYLYLDKQQVDKAKTMSQKAVELEPENLYYIDTYAKILQRAGDTAEAQVLIERALRLATPEAEGNAIIWELAGDLAYQNGQKTEALHYWKEAQHLGGGSILLKKKINKQRYCAPSKKEALLH